MTKTITAVYSGTVTQPPSRPRPSWSSSFVCKGSELEQALVEADGDPRKLEKVLGMDEEYLVDNPYVVRVANIKGVII